ncbi:transposase [Pontibacter sp. BT731]|uniref:transposase n=1 Tax=Pontibacter coccineus TaxID=3063328 RepID=UPI0026E20AFA|nr:transposase [Pontibacter sp. BT731]MDO6390065.1 transposase [Pontibacter sp. BT731]
MQERKLRERIVAEYLLGGRSYRRLGEKHGVNFYQIRRWALKHQGQMKSPPKFKSFKLSLDLQRDAPLPTDVKELQAELRKTRLEKEVLLEVIKIAEEELGSTILKKSGTKQS